jgi:DNA-binding CsgD family transcriptional regulator
MVAQNTLLDLAGSLPLGVILVSGNRRVISLNQRAREITAKADSLTIRNNELSAALNGQTRKLGKLIANALRGETGGPNAMALFRDHSRWPLWLLVLPVESRCAAVVVSDPAWKPFPDGRVLADLFRLTPAECRLAALLMQGASLLEAGMALQITRYTARAHLKLIFEKTGVDRQSRLMYLLLSSPTSISVTGAEPRIPEALKSAPALHKNGTKRNKTAIF